MGPVVCGLCVSFAGLTLYWAELVWHPLCRVPACSVYELFRFRSLMCGCACSFGCCVPTVVTIRRSQTAPQCQSTRHAIKP
eukprot:6889018-Prymnesium_polylepis.1